jgi:type IV pilus assembly protein PilA
MLDMLRKRRDEEGGFTLIELMVVVLIIAILLAIAIPTFLGARQRAQDRAAQSNLRNAFTAEKVYYTDNQAYTEDVSALSDLEKSITWVNTGTPAAGSREVLVEVQSSASGTDDIVCLTAKSASGKTFVLADIASGSNAGTYYGTDPSSFTCDEGSVSGLESSW